MLANTPDKYRWVNPIEDANNWGRRLITVRMDPVADGWEPVPVEWVPETARRIAPDFPQFWSGMLCISKRAVTALARLLDEAGELRPAGRTGGQVRLHRWRGHAIERVCELVGSKMRGHD